jgi:hypothetical protein
MLPVPLDGVIQEQRVFFARPSILASYISSIKRPRFVRAYTISLTGATLGDHNRVPQGEKPHGVNHNKRVPIYLQEEKGGRRREGG